MAIDKLLAERRALTAMRVTLNGKAAVITGAACDFATVRSLDLQNSVTYSWDAVLRIVAKGGNFHA